MAPCDDLGGFFHVSVPEDPRFTGYGDSLSEDDSILFPAGMNGARIYAENEGFLCGLILLNKGMKFLTKGKQICHGDPPDDRKCESDFAGWLRVKKGGSSFAVSLR